MLSCLSAGSAQLSSDTRARETDNNSPLAVSHTLHAAPHTPISRRQLHGSHTHNKPTHKKGHTCAGRQCVGPAQQPHGQSSLPSGPHRLCLSRSHTNQGTVRHTHTHKPTRRHTATSIQTRHRRSLLTCHRAASMQSQEEPANTASIWVIVADAGAPTVLLLALRACRQSHSSMKQCVQNTGQAV